MQVLQGWTEAVQRSDDKIVACETSYAWSARRAWKMAKESPQPCVVSCDGEMEELTQ